MTEQVSPAYSFRIWIDADACPIPVKELIFRYAFNFKISVRLVANSFQKIPRSALISLVVVDKGPDVADQYIHEGVNPGDIVVTSDIPLAKDLIVVAAHVITPKGETLDEANISERLSVRNFFDHLRSSGQHHSRSASYDGNHKKQFAASLDRLVTRRRQDEDRAREKAARDELKT